MNKKRIVLSGLIFPFTMLHLFWRALERREDVELFVLGPYTGDYIPWNNGMRLPTKYVKIPNLALPQQFATQSLDSRFVEVQLPWKPDLWIQCDAGFHFSNRPNAEVVAHIQTDPHVLKEHYRRAKPMQDVNFCMQMSYMDADEKYLPYAFDPTIHFPEEEKIEHDACLIGLHYETRDALVGALRNRGWNVHYSIGEVYDDFRKLYNQSSVALNWSSLLDLNARTFEAMGLNMPLLTNRIPDLANFFVEGDHYFGFDTVSEAVDKFAWIMSHPAEADEVASAAYRKVKEAHTWDHRVQQLLETCKIV